MGTKSRKIWRAERVLVRTPYVQCVVCGMDIVPDALEFDTMWRMTWGRWVRYLEDDCVSYFIHGHPDEDDSIGDINWEKKFTESFNSDFYNDTERTPFHRATDGPDTDWPENPPLDELDFGRKY
jgi:hypothetical protein